MSKNKPTILSITSFFFSLLLLHTPLLEGAPPPSPVPFPTSSPQDPDDLESPDSPARIQARMQKKRGKTQRSERSQGKPYYQ